VTLRYALVAFAFAGLSARLTSVRAGAHASSGQVTVVVPELPRTYLNTDYVTPTGRVREVANGGDLQAALDAAEPGDVVQLARGSTFRGRYLLPRKTGNGIIVVRTNVALGDEGTRMTPSRAADVGLAKLVAVQPNAPALRTEAGTSGWRIMGLEVTVDPSVSVTESIVRLGDGSRAQNEASKIPSNIVLDRVYVHGHPRLQLQRCVSLQSASSAVIDSYLSECHGKGFDSQAIAGWNGPGPYKIVNNYLEGAGENVMFGGADPQISGMLPSDIEFRQNFVFKPLSWKGRWTIKNSFELKMGIRVLVEGNVFENTWIDGQADMIALKSANTANAPWTETRDVTIRYNILKNAPNGITASANPAPLPVVPMSKVRIENNLLVGIGTANGTSMGRGMLLSRVAYMQVEHNTIVHNATLGSGAFLIFDVASPKMLDLVVRNNVADAGSSYGMAVFGSGTAQGVPTLNRYAAGWRFDGNVIIGMKGPTSAYPRGNFFAPTLAAVGFSNPGTGDYSLSPRSAFRRRASDGSDPGVDMTTLRVKTSGVDAR
jgi:hypothetical protein